MPVYQLGEDRPEIGEDVFIAPNAQVIGRVRIGRGASVWFGAVIRGDNEWIEIGADTNIQDNAVLHSDLGSPLAIGAGCTIGHAAIVHGCQIGENVLIGMGATVLNGAKVGDRSIVGANAHVTEGKTFPESSLVVGAPAKVVRTLDAAAAEKLKESARHYRDNGRRYAAGLKRIDG
ncbi:gamma carbonic anhydrase family protein [Jiella sonneratiae]|uniref:Gamma carbonic anhydrase family protein n=1 Tax=Jiella sonneratiae TaxID=2816856 RepID=A0ABS3J4L2_9HYPH|nr:gamma carbonic anhydrase family protein [Jiella sonneratiae]MBO0904611.1 gamma carbonic anhydrase family protein [Jiella sonneratiae]